MKNELKGFEYGSWMNELHKEIMLKIEFDVKEQERKFWELREIDAKIREDIKNGKPIYFNGFIDRLTNGTQV